MTSRTAIVVLQTGRQRKDVLGGGRDVRGVGGSHLLERLGTSGVARDTEPGRRPVREGHGQAQQGGQGKEPTGFFSTYGRERVTQARPLERAPRNFEGCCRAPPESRSDSRCRLPTCPLLLPRSG